MSKQTFAQKIVLPKLVLSELCEPSDLNALLADEGKQHYYRRHLSSVDATEVDGGGALPELTRFNLFPLVLNKNGIPWVETNLCILSSIEDSSNLDMRRFEGHSLDLAAYLRFIEEADVDWLDFCDKKLLRPTYRYRSYLNIALAAGKVRSSLVRRRIGSVIWFYRWLIAECGWKPRNSPWVESDVYITHVDLKGFLHTVKRPSTDLSVNQAKQDDPYDGTILEGERLRPLSMVEQQLLIEALAQIGHIEITLIFLLGLLTGARLQTICTLQVFHLEKLRPVGGFARLAAGPDTGVDTKGDKELVLHIPQRLVQVLNIYARSKRATRRRLKANKNNQGDYLFLSKFGNPFYANKV